MGSLATKPTRNKLQGVGIRSPTISLVHLMIGTHYCVPIIYTKTTVGSILAVCIKQCEIKEASCIRYECSEG